MATDNFSFSVPGGTVSGVPRWSTEETLSKLLVEVRKITGGKSSGRDPSEVTAEETKRSNNLIQRLIDAVEDGDSDRSDEAKEAEKTRGKQNRATILNNRLIDKLLSVAEKTWSFMKDMLGKLWSILKSVASGIAAATGLSYARIKDTYNSLLGSLKDMRKSGLGLAESAAGPSALQFLDGVRSLGIGLDKSAAILTTHSYAVATNRKGILNIVKEFQKLNDSGATLGMTIDESTELMAEELEFRSKILMGNRVSEKERAEQAQNLIKSQMKYSSILGITLESIRSVSKSLISGSNNAQASLLMLGDAAGEQTLTALTEFTSSLTGRGFDQGFTSALLESATGITSLADESSRNFFTAASVAGMDYFDIISQMNNDIKSGALSTEKAVGYSVDLTNRLASTSEQGIFQLQVMAQYGDQAAAELLKTINSARQARKSAEALAGEDAAKVDTTLQKLASLTNSITAISENFKLFKQKLQLTFLPILERFAKVFADKGILNTLGEVGDQIAAAITRFFEAIGLTSLSKGKGSLTDLAGQVQGLMRIMGFHLVKFIDWFSKTVGPLFKPGEDGETRSIVTSFKELGAKIAEAVWQGIWGVLSNSWKTLLVMTVGVGVIAGLATVLGKFAGVNLMKGIAALGGLSLALYSLGTAFDAWGKVNWNQVNTGLDALGKVGIMTALIAGILALTGGTGALVIGGAELVIAGLGLALRAFPWEDMSKFGESLMTLSKVEPAKITAVAGALVDLAIAMGKLAESGVTGFWDGFKGFFGKETNLLRTVRSLEKLASINTADLVNNLKILSDIQNGETIKVEYVNTPPAMMATLPTQTSVTSVTGAAPGTETTATTATPSVTINYAAETLARLTKMGAELEKANRQLSEMPTLIARAVN